LNRMIHSIIESFNWVYLVFHRSAPESGGAAVDPQMGVGISKRRVPKFQQGDVTRRRCFLYNLERY
jgi:hypothetical protein